MSATALIAALSFSIENDNIGTQDALDYILTLCRTHDKLLLLDQICKEYSDDPYTKFFFPTKSRPGRTYMAFGPENRSYLFRRIEREKQPMVYAINEQHDVRLLFDPYGNQTLKLTSYSQNSPAKWDMGPTSLISAIGSEIRAWHDHPVEHEILKQQYRLALAQVEAQDAIVKQEQAKVSQEQDKAKIYRAMAREAEARATIVELEANKQIIKSPIVYEQAIHPDEGHGNLIERINKQPALIEAKNAVPVPEEVKMAIPNLFATKGPLEIEAKLFYYNEIGKIHELSSKLNVNIKHAKDQLDIKV